MKIRRLALCAAAVLLACTHPHAETTADIVDHSRPSKGVLDVAPEEMASVVEAKLRVAPDRRFLLAARDIDQLKTGRKEPVSLDFADGRWNVSVGTTEAFSLPDLPTFADGLNALTTFAAKVDSAGKPADYATLAHTATLLNEQQPDRFGVADEERAWALALIALARSAHPNAAEDDVAVMANICGYTTEARQLGLKPQSAAARGKYTVSPEIDALHKSALELSSRYDEYFDAVEQLGSQPDAEDLAKRANATEGALFEVDRWVRDAIDLHFHGGAGVIIDKSIAAVPHVGGERRAELLLAATRTFGTSTPAVRHAAFEIFGQCDSRPSQLYVLGRVANEILSDPSRRDRYLAAALARGRTNLEDGVAGWITTTIGDEAGMRAIAFSDAQSPYERAVVLSSLAKVDGADQTQVAALFETLVGKSSKAYSRFVVWANEHHAWTLKERLARRALGTEENSIEQAYIAASLADALMRLGRNADALRIVKPYIEVQNFAIFSAAMETRAANGDRNGADQMAQTLMDRYPGADANVDCARVLWKQKRYEEAAALLDPKRYSLVPLQVARELAVAFDGTFDDAHLDDAVAALAPIVPMISADDAVTMLRDLQLSGRNALAFRLADRLLANPAHHKMDECVVAWRAAAAVNGPAAASAWLQQHVGDADRVALVLQAHQDADELVAQYALPAVSAKKTAEMQLIIAASLVRLHAPATDPRMAAFTDAFRAQPPANDFFSQSTRYLLGIGDARAAAAVAKDVDARASVAYFRGLRAAYEGRYDEALSWMLAVEAIPKEPGWPLNWTTAQLIRWNNSHLSWSEIKRRRVS